MNYRNLSNRRFKNKDILALSFSVLCLNILIAKVYSLAGYGYPQNSFLFYEADRFADFFKVIDALHVVKTWDSVNDYDSMGLPYYKYLFPASATIYLFFAKAIELVGNKYIVYALMFLIVLGYTSFVSKKLGNSWIVVLLFLLSYPVIFSIDRGNLAIIVFMFILISLTTENTILATCALSIAVAIKFTPIIFIIPILFGTGKISVMRVVKILALILFWTIAIDLLSVAINGRFLLPSTYNPLIFLETINVYSGTAIKELAGLTFNSALYTPLAYLFIKIGGLSSFIEVVKPIFLPLLFFGIVGVTILIWQLNLNNQIKKSILIQLAFDLLFIALFNNSPFVLLLLLSTSIVSLIYSVMEHREFKIEDIKPTIDHYFNREKLIYIVCTTFVVFMPVTGDYYLLVMMIPLLLFPKSTYSFYYFLIYGLLLGAKNIIWVDQVHGSPIAIQTFINPVLLIFMLLAEFDLLPFMKRSSSISSN